MCNLTIILWIYIFGSKIYKNVEFSEFTQNSRYPLEKFELINTFCLMEDFIKTNDGFIQITCYFCFEPFEVQLEVSSENFLKKNSEIIDCTICCNPNKIDYEVNENGISTISITDGND